MVGARSNDPDRLRNLDALRERIGDDGREWSFNATNDEERAADAGSGEPVSAGENSAAPSPNDPTAPTDNSFKKGLAIGLATAAVAAALIVGGVALSGGGSNADNERSNETATAAADSNASGETEADGPESGETDGPDNNEADGNEADGNESEGDADSALEEAPEDQTAIPDEDESSSDDDVAPVEADPDVVRMAIPMRDIESPDRDASGVLSFDFNEEAGEVCYSIEAENIAAPFNTHIHAENFGVKGGVVVDMGEQEAGATDCVPAEPNIIADILGNPLGHYAELHDPGGVWTIRGQLVETVDNPGIITVAVPMADPDNIAPDAAGELSFDFNTITGEVCFAIEASNIGEPFNTHIHDGARGEKSGVVLDMGPNEAGNTGCVDNLAIDTAAILANPAGHYAELHDPAGEWTIRGQLSDAAVAGADRQGGVVDTKGDGARIVLRDGSAILEGPVPDEATAEELRQTLAGLEAPVTDNLRIVDDAARPTGRIVFGDGVFFDSGSDEVRDIDEETLTLIVGLAQSRPDWVLTVVGHTDSDGSEATNLELSLRRATAVRDLLASQGVADENLRIRGSGETQPVAGNETADGKAANRRIEFEFTPA